MLTAAGTIGTPVHPAAAAIGEGRPVLMIPGLGAGDSSLLRACSYLRACDYEVWRSHITCNVDCSEATVGRLLARLEHVAEWTGQRVALVGHSRGGLLARVLSRRRPDLVAGAVTLGSPFRDQLAVHPVVWANLAALGSLGSLGVPGIMRYGCAASDCCAGFRIDLAAAVDPRVSYLAVYSRRDGIVDWRACLDPVRRNLEVLATHIGMILDGNVLAEVANAIHGFYADERRPERANAGRDTHALRRHRSHRATRRRTSAPAHPRFSMYHARALNALSGMEPAPRPGLGHRAESDERLLERLGELLRAIDPVPAHVLGDASDLFTSRFSDGGLSHPSAR